MKNYLKIYLSIIATFLFFSFFIALILTFINKNQKITSENGLMISTIFSFIIIALLSFALGLKVKKHGILHASILSIMIIALSFILHDSIIDYIFIIKLISKLLIIFFFTILGVNKKS